MRFEDLDVLLFPGADSTAHVPSREFNVRCAGAIESQSQPMGPVELTPIMACFVPSLDAGHPFQVSVHSWKPQKLRASIDVALTADSPQQVWSVQTSIDGKAHSVEIFPANTTWPVVISLANTQVIEGRVQPLRFPHFHRDVLSEDSWSALTNLGRIKVEISEGLLKGPKGKQGFVKLCSHVTFVFQHAPMTILQDFEIAWPNKRMMLHPIRTAPSAPVFSTRTQRRNMSISSMLSSSPGLNYPMPGPPPPTPNYSHDLLPPRSMFDGSSRSTSAYSNIPVSALPMAMHGAGNKSPSYPDSMSDRTTRPESVQFRLPSDQFDRILGAMNANNESRFGPLLNAGSMLPPPLPQHAVAAKASANDEQPSPRGARSRGRTGGHDGSVRPHYDIDDEPMHGGHDEHPSCMSQEVDATAAIMRGRKEGSVNETGRDFFSNIMNPQSDAEASATEPSTGDTEGGVIVPTQPSSSPAAGTLPKKRTRAALKALNANDSSSPGRQDQPAKPARKLRKRVTAGSDDD